MITIKPVGQVFSKITATSEELDAIRDVVREAAKSEVFIDCRLDQRGGLDLEELQAVSEHIDGLDDVKFFISKSQLADILAVFHNGSEAGMDVSGLDNINIIKDLERQLETVRASEIYEAPRTPHAPLDM